MEPNGRQAKKIGIFEIFSGAAEATIDGVRRLYFFRRGLRGAVGRPAVSWSRCARICSADRPARRSSGGNNSSTSRCNSLIPLKPLPRFSLKVARERLAAPAGTLANAVRALPLGDQLPAASQEA